MKATYSGAKISVGSSRVGGRRVSTNGSQATTLAFC